MNPSDLADAVLRRMVDAHNRSPGFHFIYTRSARGRERYRLTHPGGSTGASERLIEELLERRLIVIVAEEPGFKTLDVTLRGFDYVARHPPRQS